MGHAMVSGGSRASVPVTGIKLGDIAVGQLVKINENGSPVEFYVAKHEYESALNGTGRTLLVRKDCYDSRQWHSSKLNNYATSDIDNWLNGTYKNLLDAKVRTAIGTTKFYYTPGNGDYNVTTLSRGIFLLSIKELGFSDSTYGTVEGSTLPIASVLQVPNINLSYKSQWTRTPCQYNSPYNVYLINNSSGTWGIVWYSATDNEGSRPCFTLPSSTFFDSETLLFKGVA